MKKLVAFFMILILLTALSGCGKAMDSSSSPKSEKEIEMNSSSENAVKMESPEETITNTQGIKITGPVLGGIHGQPFASYFGDIRNVGYVEEEFFLEGNAIRYQPVGELTRDGKWSLEEMDLVPYKTRILVRRPADASVFNGTVVIEWANVSSGYEIALADAPGFYKDGYAYVLVSAQPTGLHGFASNPHAVVNWDEQRYGTLFISDDGVSFDIFTQAAISVGPNRPTDGVDPMGGLEVKTLIGTGGSQSGSRILAYANGVQPIENVFDGLIPFICAGAASDFEGELAHPDRDAGNTGHSRTVMTLVREDLATKVIQLNTQTEALYYSINRQPDSDSFRSWEVAGATHFPTRQMQMTRQITDRDGMTKSIDAFTAVRSSDVNYLYTLESAVTHMQRWVTEGVLPPKVSPMKISADRKSFICDEHGNALGGIRLPEVEVPIANYVAPMSVLSGYTIPFTADKLMLLYPSHDDYVEKVKTAAVAAMEAGFIPEYRFEEYIKMAETANVPDIILPDLG